MEGSQPFVRWKKELTEKVASNISTYLAQHNISERRIAALITSEYGISCNASNINNALSSGNKNIQLSLPLALAIAKIVQIPLEAFASDEWKDYNTSSKKIAHNEIASRLFDMLCSDNHRHFDPSNVAFESLAGQYHCYFWATDNTSSTPHHATLKLIPNTYLCEVTFELKYQNNRRAKVYTGYAFATDAHICFCILRGKRNVTTGELCLLAFKYFPINSGPLPIALAEALTVSTGNSERAPVTHRMLLSRQEIDASEIKDVFPCISIYPLSLFVEEDIVTKLSLSDDEKRVLTQAVSASTPGTYIRLSELIIKGLGEQQGLNSSQTMTLIHKIRQESAKKNNDIVTLEDRQLAYHILTDNTHTEDISDAD